MRRTGNELELTIGEELRTLRKRKKLPLSEVAERINVSSVYISEIERDKKVPSDSVIYKLAEIYEVDALEFFTKFNRVPEIITREILNNEQLFKVLYEITHNEIDETKKIELGNKFLKEFRNIFKH